MYACFMIHPDFFPDNLRIIFYPAQDISGEAVCAAGYEACRGEKEHHEIAEGG